MGSGKTHVASVLSAFARPIGCCTTKTPKVYRQPAAAAEAAAEAAAAAAAAEATLAGAGHQIKSILLFSISYPARSTYSLHQQPQQQQRRRQRRQQRQGYVGRSSSSK
jgi:hypothetical protein